MARLTLAIAALFVAAVEAGCDCSWTTEGLPCFPHPGCRPCAPEKDDGSHCWGYCCNGAPSPPPFPPDCPNEQSAKFCKKTLKKGQCGTKVHFDKCTYTCTDATCDIPADPPSPPPPPPPPSPPPPCNPTDTDALFRSMADPNVVMWINNLGGMGPDTPDDYSGPATISYELYQKALIFGNVGYVNGHNIAVVITNMTAYDTLKATNNGINEDMGQINVGPSFAADPLTILAFHLVDTDNECGDYDSYPPCNLYVMPRFYVTYYDFDQSGTLEERVIAKGMVYADFAYDSELTPPNHDDSPRAIDLTTTAEFISFNDEYDAKLYTELIDAPGAPGGYIRRYKVEGEDECEVLGPDGLPDPAGCWLYISASIKGIGGDNPTEASNVNDLQWSRSVVLYYENTGILLFGASASYIDESDQTGGGRNFLFAYTTPLDPPPCAQNENVAEYFNHFNNGWELGPHDGLGGQGDDLADTGRRRKLRAAGALESAAASLEK